jgi:hypothetical protein
MMSCEIAAHIVTNIPSDIAADIMPNMSASAAGAILDECSALDVISPIIQAICETLKVGAVQVDPRLIPGRAQDYPRLNPG